MADIKAAEAIKNYAKDLGNYREKIIGYKERLQTETDKIEEAWQGADATRYIAKLRDDYVLLMDKLTEGLEEYVKHLEKVYPEYEKVDNTYYKSKQIEV